MSIDYAEISYTGLDGLAHTEEVDSKYGVHMQLVLEQATFVEERGAHDLLATLGYGDEQYQLTPDELRGVMLGSKALHDFRMEA